MEDLQMRLENIVVLADGGNGQTGRQLLIGELLPLRSDLKQLRRCLAQ